jgi:acyl-CoA thioester hydrolase
MTTRWSDNDIYGHLNNTVHHALADAAVNAWMIEAGVLDIHAGARIGLMVENGFRYFAEMAYPDPVVAGVGVTRIGASSVRWEIGLFRGDEPTAAAQGFFVHVYVDRATRKPIPLDAATRAALETVLLHD